MNNLIARLRIVMRIDLSRRECKVLNDPRTGDKRDEIKYTIYSFLISRFKIENISIRKDRKTDYIFMWK